MRTLVATLCGVSLMLTGCGAGALEDSDEVGHATGDVMASFDEGGQGGAFAQAPIFHRPEYGRPALWQEVRDLVSPSASAASCFTAASAFSACSNGQKTRQFQDCSIGAATLSGSVTLAFSETACTMSQANDTVTRTADFTLTGPRAGTLTVSTPGGGQTITRTASGFTYKVGGIERVATDTKGTKLFDITTSTTADIGVTGASRKERVMDGGTLHIKHNLANYTVDLTPKQVKWDGTCNCAVSGSWEGTVTTAAGKTEPFTIAITGCGKATVTAQTKSKDVTLDRCAGL
jgi:hypothetical protein